MLCLCEIYNHLHYVCLLLIYVCVCMFFVFFLFPWKSIFQYETLLNIYYMSFNKCCWVIWSKVSTAIRFHSWSAKKREGSGSGVWLLSQITGQQFICHGPLPALSFLTTQQFSKKLSWWIYQLTTSDIFFSVISLESLWRLRFHSLK